MLQGHNVWDLQSMALWTTWTMICNGLIGLSYVGYFTHKCDQRPLLCVIVLYVRRM